MPSYDDDLRLAHVLADAVEGTTMGRFGATDLAVETKPDLTLVSDADRAAEDLLRGQLGRTRPRDAVVGEESGTTSGRLRLSWGAVRVRRRVTSFVRRLPGGEIIGTHALDLPEQVLTTRGVWWTMTPDLLEDAGVAEDAVPGAAHAAEHAAIGALPLLATCDRWDIGGVSTDLHPDTGLPTILVYDGYPGGAGFSARAHDTVQRWWQATLEIVDGCSCRQGCPRCVQSPKCGNGNEPLDKDGAGRLLRAILAERG